MHALVDLEGDGVVNYKTVVIDSNDAICTKASPNGRAHAR